MTTSQLLTNAFPHYAIMTTRRDKVRQAISWWKALETFQWYNRTTDSMPARRKPVFCFDAIECLRQNIIDHEQHILNFFATHAIKPFIVIYEDFVDVYEETAMQILDFLHIPIPNNLAFARRTLQKQSDSQTEEWVQLYYQMQHEQEMLLTSHILL